MYVRGAEVYQTKQDMVMEENERIEEGEGIFFGERYGKQLQFK